MAQIGVENHGEAVYRLQDPGMILNYIYTYLVNYYQNMVLITKYHHLSYCIVFRPNMMVLLFYVYGPKGIIHGKLIKTMKDCDIKILFDNLYSMC